MIYHAEATFVSLSRAILDKSSLRLVSVLPFNAYQRDVADMHEGIIFVEEGNEQFLALFDGDVQVFSHVANNMYQTC